MPGAFLNESWKRQRRAAAGMIRPVPATVPTTPTTLRPGQSPSGLAITHVASRGRSRRTIAAHQSARCRRHASAATAARPSVIIRAEEGSGVPSTWAMIQGCPPRALSDVIPIEAALKLSHKTPGRSSRSDSLA